MLLVRAHQRLRLNVPQAYDAVVVAAGQLLPKVAVPADARQLGVVIHLVQRIVNALLLIYNRVKVVDLDALRHAGYGEMLVGAVEINRANNTRHRVRVAVVVDRRNRLELAAIGYL